MMQGRVARVPGRRRRRAWAWACHGSVRAALEAGRRRGMAAHCPHHMRSLCLLARRAPPCRPRHPLLAPASQHTLAVQRTSCCSGWWRSTACRRTSATPCCTRWGAAPPPPSPAVAWGAGGPSLHTPSPKRMWVHAVAWGGAAGTVGAPHDTRRDPTAAVGVLTKRTGGQGRAREGCWHAAADAAAACCCSPPPHRSTSASPLAARRRSRRCSAAACSPSTSPSSPTPRPQVGSRVSLLKACA